MYWCAMAARSVAKRVRRGSPRSRKARLVSASPSSRPRPPFAELSSLRQEQQTLFFPQRPPPAVRPNKLLTARATRPACEQCAFGTLARLLNYIATGWHRGSARLGGGSGRAIVQARHFLSSSSGPSEGAAHSAPHALPHPLASLGLAAPPGARSGRRSRPALGDQNARVMTPAQTRPAPSSNGFAGR